MKKRILKALAVSLVWLFLWQAAAMLVDKAVLLPSPLMCLRSLLELARTAGLWLDIGASMLRVLVGFLLGTVLGCTLALLMKKSDFLNSLFNPFLSAVKATPVASFIILAFVWLPVWAVPVFTAVLIVLPVICASVRSGIEGVDPGLLEMAKIYGMKKGARLRHIYLPSIVPVFMGGVSTALGMAWKASIAAEVICRCRLSIGGSLYDAKVALDTDKVFAFTAVVIVLSIVFERVALFTIKKALRRLNHD